MNKYVLSDRAADTGHMQKIFFKIRMKWLLRDMSF